MRRVVMVEERERERETRWLDKEEGESTYRESQHYRLTDIWEEGVGDMQQHHRQVTLHVIRV